MSGHDEQKNARHAPGSPRSTRRKRQPGDSAERERPGRIHFADAATAALCKTDDSTVHAPTIDGGNAPSPRLRCNAPAHVDS
ncbi:MAG: hypothetical protein QM769_02935 [Pseudoxanthomonas sp.]